jgi:AcrR family transcriptional regulator
MSSTDSPVKQSAKIESTMRGGKRRKRIFQALHDCIIEKGYAKTTLADVARTANMTPSHLLYYFSGKDAILEDFFENVAERIVERMEGFRTETADRRIDLLAELFFAGKGITMSEIGFMLECFGVAVHDQQLHSEKTALDRFCKAYLEELFNESPCGPSMARDSAEVAYALLIGLRTAVYFDERIGLPRARRLFRASVLNLANSGQPGR